jgi:hypothetical protein
VVERLEHPLAAETVQGPEEHQVELPLGGICKEPLELLPVGVFACGAVHVLMSHRPALGGDEGAELRKLVLSVLTFVSGGNPGVQCNFHRTILPQKRSLLQQKFTPSGRLCLQHGFGVSGDPVFETAFFGSDTTLALVTGVMQNFHHAH